MKDSKSKIDAAILCDLVDANDIKGLILDVIDDLFHDDAIPKERIAEKLYTALERVHDMESSMIDRMKKASQSEN